MIKNSTALISKFCLFCCRITKSDQDVFKYKRGCLEEDTILFLIYAIIVLYIL